MMRDAPHLLTRLLGILTALALFGGPLAGCSDDTMEGEGGTNNGEMTANSGGDQCPEGQRFNPVLGRCVEEIDGDDNPNGADNSVNGSDNSDPSNNADENNTSGSNADPGDNNTSPANNADAGDMGAPGNNGAAGDMGQGDMGVSMDPDMKGPPTGDMDTQMMCGLGSIKGRACAPSGDVLAGATITVTGTDCATGQAFERTVTTQGDGTYALMDISSGLHDVTIASGSFSRTFPALVRAGEETDLTRQASKFCLEADAVKIAVIQGEFDDVEGILDDLGLEYEIKGTDGGSPNILTGQPSDSQGLNDTRTFLKDLTVMKEYDIIFINCGYLWDILNNNHSGDVATIVSNLQDYYRDGRSVYASDWAHMFIERPFANVLDFFPPGAINDTSANNARMGYAPQMINAAVESTQLQSLLGVQMVTIDFPHDPPDLVNNNWVMMSSADASATVHLRGDAQQCANQQGCSSPGATSQGVPLLVTYTNPVTGGSMAFTSFHNHPEGTPISPEISAILKFLIFQL